MDPITIIMFTCYIILTVSGITFVKFGGLDKAVALFTLPVINFAVSWQTLVGILCYGFSFVLYIIIITKADLSFIIPISTAITYIALMVIAFTLFNESFNALKIIGCGLILIGVLFVIVGGK